MYSESAFKDAEEARQQTIALLSAVADARGWSGSARDRAYSDVDVAYDLSDEGFTWSDLWGNGADPEVFYSELLSLSESWGDLGGLSDLQAAWASAAGAAALQEEEEEAGSASTIIGGTIEGSLEDIAEMAGAANTAAKSPASWAIAAAAAVVALLVLVRR